jgi:hypothetical protein
MVLIGHLAGCSIYRLVPPDTGEGQKGGYTDLSQVVREGDRIRVKAQYKATVDGRVRWVTADSMTVHTDKRPQQPLVDYQREHVRTIEKKGFGAVKTLLVLGAIAVPIVVVAATAQVNSFDVGMTK